MAANAEALGPVDSRWPALVVPELEPHCGSWIVSRRDDGAAVAEFFERATVVRINQGKYRVETAAQYLGRINAAIRAEFV